MIQYAPFIADTIPAFISNKIIIPFEHNPAVGSGEFNKYQLIIKDLSSNTIGTSTCNKPNNETNELIFDSIDFIADNGSLIVGQYYKFQLAYKYDNNIGPYSSVAIGRYIKDAPKLELIGLGPDNAFYGICEGKMTDNNKIENLYSYHFKLYSDDNVLQDTGEQLYDNLHQLPQIFESEYDIDDKHEYAIEYSITTINGYQDSITCSVITPTGNDCPAKLTLGQDLSGVNTKGYHTAINNGYLEIQIEAVNNNDLTNKQFVIERRRDDEDRWEKLVLVTYSNTLLLKDLTLEQGVLYKYSIKEKIEEYKYSNRNTTTDPISIDFEDIYLSDNEKQLKIRFDPKVSSLKNTVLESKTDTIGSPYPFFFRNGTVKYKEIPISGLISYQMDEDDMFTNNKPQTTLSWMTAENVAAERKFKLEVLEWLNNGKPKLFRSPTEGNYMIRLMNVSLSPNDTLSRTIHSFSATGYEISPIDIQSLAQKHDIDYAISALGYFILGISPLGNGEE